MKKLFRVLILPIAAVLLAGCAGTERESSSSGSQSSSGSSSSASSAKVTSQGSSEQSTVSVPIQVIPELPTEDIPEDVYGKHDLSYGNFIYNPNVTDTSQEALMAALKERKEDTSDG